MLVCLNIHVLLFTFDNKLPCLLLQSLHWVMHKLLLVLNLTHVLLRSAFWTDCFSLQAVKDTLMLLQASSYLLPCLINLLQVVKICLERRQCLVVDFSEASIWLVNIWLGQALRLVQRLEIMRDSVSCKTGVRVRYIICFCSTLLQMLLSYIVPWQVLGQTDAVRHIVVSETLVLALSLSIGVCTESEALCSLSKKGIIPVVWFIRKSIYSLQILSVEFGYLIQLADSLICRVRFDFRSKIYVFHRGGSMVLLGLLIWTISFDFDLVHGEVSC